MRLTVSNGILIGSAVFAQLKLESPYTYNVPPLFPKIALPTGDVDHI